MKTGTKRGERLYDLATAEDIIISFKRYNEFIHKNAIARKLYFAGPFFTDKAKAFQKGIINLWDKIERVNRFSYGFFPMLSKEDTPAAIFNNNIKMLDECDEMLAFVSEKDVGTALEIGYFIAKGKPVTLLVYHKSDFLSHTNLMLSFGAKAIETSKLYKFFTTGCSEEDYIKVENVWEGIE